MLDPQRDALPDSADSIKINGEICPGKSTVMKPNSPRGWDERNGYGLNGATLYPKGDPLATFSVLQEVWKGADYLAWKAYCAKYFAKAVRTTPGSTTPRALGIYHPLLADPPISISEVVVEDIVANGQDEDGLWSWEIKFKQYRKPKPAPQAPVAAIAAAGTPKPTATDAAEQQIQQLSATFAKLQGGG